MKGYTKLNEIEVKELDCKFTIYSHDKTKARVATIECDDDNKVFSIAFRTPPIDNTGLTHILEHSVLCGSDKYEVKDPFVELLKSSLNTFLNAITFPDKTMYPIASKNLKDFKNLTDVYMDAVFHPNIYKHKEIFLQEGWHYHLEKESDDIAINGVVYNEMKGAFSNPIEILFRTIKKSLFPNNAYGFESGGDPKYIPDLTYEKFLDFHSKYYSASNSYIFIYGDCDMNERLEYLDREYLSKMDYVDFDTSLKYQEKFKKPVYKCEYYTVNGDTKNKAYLSYNVVLPSSLDTKVNIATSILVDSLFDITGAPLKKAIIDAGIGDDVEVSLDNELLEPILTIAVLNANSVDEERFIELVDNKLEELIEKGFDKKSILSIINHEEFLAREKSFSNGLPKGLMVIMSSISTWLYDDNNVCGNLEVIKYFKELKEDLENGYFEKLAKNLILNNKHKSFVKLVPQSEGEDKFSIQLKAKLDEFKKSLSKDEIDNLIKETKNLEVYQNTPDSKEGLDSIPKLSEEDFITEPEKLNLEVIDGKYTTLFSKYHTNGISYVENFFDITDLNDIDLRYLNLYTSVLGKMDTEYHSYFELNENVRNNLGGIAISISAKKKKNREPLLDIRVAGSALNDKLEYMYDIFDEVIYHTDFSDKKRLYEIIAEIKSTNDLAVSGRGNGFAINRALSFFDGYYHIRDILSGIDYLDFIKDIYENFDEMADILIEKFKTYNKLFAKENFIAGYTGEDITEFKKLSDKFYSSLNDNLDYEKEAFIPYRHNEAISTPYDVNFVSRAGSFEGELKGSIEVLQNALNLDYLWDRIRVHGGAYGAMMRVENNGTIGFVSYRDPNIDSTDENYKKIVEYIENINFNDEELLKYKIGALGSRQLVLHNKDKGALAKSLYMRGYTYEDRKETLNSLLNCKTEDLRNYANVFKEVLDDSVLCVIGNKDKVNESKLEFDIKRDI